MPTCVRKFIRELDFSYVLGSDVNQRELCELLDVVDGVDWSEVPVSQARRGTHRIDASPGSTANDGDLVW